MWPGPVCQYNGWPKGMSFDTNPKKDTSTDSKPSIETDTENDTKMTLSHSDGSKSRLGEIKKNWPEFTEACRKGKLEDLLKYSTIPGIFEHQDGQTKKTCLHFACENDDVEPLKWILKNFPRLDNIINLRDSLNRSAIFFAARSSVRESVRLLKERGAKISQEDWILDSRRRWVIHHTPVDNTEQGEEEVRLRVHGTSVVVSKSTFFSNKARGSYFEILFGSSPSSKVDPMKQSHTINDWCVRHENRQHDKEAMEYTARVQYFNANGGEIQSDHSIGLIDGCPLIPPPPGKEIKMHLRKGTVVRIACDEFEKTRGISLGTYGVVTGFAGRVPLVKFSLLAPLEPPALESSKMTETDGAAGTSIVLKVPEHTWEGRFEDGGDGEDGKKWTKWVYTALPLVVAYVPHKDMYTRGIHGFERSMAEFVIPSVSNLRCFKAILAFLEGGHKTLPEDVDVRKQLYEDAKALNLSLLASALNQEDEREDLNPFSRYGENKFVPADLICAPPASAEEILNLARTRSWYLNVVGPHNCERDAVTSKALKSWGLNDKKKIGFKIDFDLVENSTSYLRPIFGGKYENQCDAILKLGEPLNMDSKSKSALLNLFKKRQKLEKYLREKDADIDGIKKGLLPFMNGKLGVRTTNRSKLQGTHSFENPEKFKKHDDDKKTGQCEHEDDIYIHFITMNNEPKKTKKQPKKTMNNEAKKIVAFAASINITALLTNLEAGKLINELVPKCRGFQEAQNKKIKGVHWGNVSYATCKIKCSTYLDKIGEIMRGDVFERMQERLYDMKEEDIEKRLKPLDLTQIIKTYQKLKSEKKEGAKKEVSKKVGEDKFNEIWDNYVWDTYSSHFSNYESRELSKIEKNYDSLKEDAKQYDKIDPQILNIDPLSHFKDSNVDTFILQSFGTLLKYHHANNLYWSKKFEIMKEGVATSEQKKNLFERENMKHIWFDLLKRRSKISKDSRIQVRVKIKEEYVSKVDAVIQDFDLCNRQKLQLFYLKESAKSFKNQLIQFRHEHRMIQPREAYILRLQYGESLPVKNSIHVEIRYADSQCVYKTKEKEGSNAIWNETFIIKSLSDVQLVIRCNQDKGEKGQVNVGNCCEGEYAEKINSEYFTEFKGEIVSTKGKKLEGNLAFSVKAINLLDYPNKLSHLIADCKGKGQNMLPRLRGHINGYEEASRKLFESLITGENFQVVGIMNGLSFIGDSALKKEAKDNLFDASIIAKNSTASFLTLLRNVSLKTSVMFLIASEDYLDIPLRLSIQDQVTHGARIGPLAVQNPQNPRSPEKQWPTPGHIVNFIEYLLVHGSSTSANRTIKRCENMIKERLKCGWWESAQLEVKAYNKYLQIHDDTLIEIQDRQLKQKELLQSIGVAFQAINPGKIPSPDHILDMWGLIKKNHAANNDFEEVVKLIHKYYEVEQSLKLLNVKLKKFTQNDTLHKPLQWFSKKQKSSAISAFEYTKSDCERFGEQQRESYRGKKLVGKFKLRKEYEGGNNLEGSDLLFCLYADVPFRSCRPYLELLAGQCGSKVLSKYFLDWVWEKYYNILKNQCGAKAFGQGKNIFRYILELFSKLITGRTWDASAPILRDKDLEKWYADLLNQSTVPKICQEVSDKSESKDLLDKCKIILGILQAAAKISTPNESLKLVVQAYSIWLIHCIGLYLQDFGSLGRIELKKGAIGSVEENSSLAKVLAAAMPQDPKKSIQNNANKLEHYMKLLILVYGACISVGLQRSPSLADNVDNVCKPFQKLKRKCKDFFPEKKKKKEEVKEVNCMDKIYLEILHEFAMS